MSLKFGKKLIVLHAIKKKFGNASESRRKACPVAYTWKRTDLKKTITTSSSSKCM